MYISAHFDNLINDANLSRQRNSVDCRQIAPSTIQLKFGIIANDSYRRKKRIGFDQ